MTQTQVIHGPTVNFTRGVLYQVTLASGMIVTSPAGFGPESPDADVSEPVVSEDGRLLVDVTRVAPAE